MTDILLINVHSSCNAGDAALTQTAIEQLRGHFPQCHLTVAMNDPDMALRDVHVIDSFFHWVKGAGGEEPSHWRIAHLLLLLPVTLLPVLTFRLFGRAVFTLTPAPLRHQIRAYLEADLVVSKPGGFLYSSGTGLSLLISVYTLAFALLAGKPVYVFPQSIGPLTRRWECALLKWSLSKTRVIMAREPVSLEQLRACSIAHKRCYLIPDMALAFNGVPRVSAEEWLRGHGIERKKECPLLGVTAINWGPPSSRRVYETALADAIRFFVQQYGGKAILFPHVWGPSAREDDRIASRSIAAQLSELGDSVRLVETPLEPALLKSVYGQMDLFVGTRMHSNIFALTEGVPVIAIAYLHKTLGMARMLGIEPWVIDIRQINSQTLIDRLVALWAERDAVRTQIGQALPALVEQAGQPSAIAASDYRGLMEASSHG